MPQPRVLEIVFNPTFRSRGGRTLAEYCGYNDHRALTAGYIEDLAEASGGYLRYQVVETVRVDGMPAKVDGFRYDEPTFLRCFHRGQGWHQPDAVDYHAILHEFDVVRQVELGAIDELWLWGPPYTGLWESTMAGPGACWCNSPPLEGVRCSRRFVIMGFNYERGVGEMLENFGHRVESMLSHAFGSWREWGGTANHAWDRFSAYDRVAPGQAGCGTIHFAPNSERDYDWGNRRPVWSTCDDWLHYPDLRGRRRLVDCREWGGGDIRAHHLWWLGHLPRAAGRANGLHNNWWSYVVDPTSAE